MLSHLESGTSRPSPSSGFPGCVVADTLSATHAPCTSGASPWLPSASDSFATALGFSGEPCRWPDDFWGDPDERTRCFAGRGWRLQISHERLTLERRRRWRWHTTMEIPSDRLVDLQVEELVSSPEPIQRPLWRPSGSVVVCTMPGARRAVFALEGLSAYEMHLALAPRPGRSSKPQAEADRLQHEDANRREHAAGA